MFRATTSTTVLALKKHSATSDWTVYSAVQTWNVAEHHAVVTDLSPDQIPPVGL